MTEDEAKTKWCPFAAVPEVMRAPGRPSRLGLWYETSCIASACMAFRWREVLETQGSRIPMPQGNPDGYCGLAGRPS